MSGVRLPSLQLCTSHINITVNVVIVIIIHRPSCKVQAGNLTLITFHVPRLVRHDIASYRERMGHCRIATNALIDQFIAIASKQDGGLGRPTGITDPRKKLSGLVQWTCVLDSCHWRFGASAHIASGCNASNICRFAAQVSSYMCYQRFGTEPKYIVQDYQASSTRFALICHGLCMFVLQTEKSETLCSESEAFA